MPEAPRSARHPRHPPAWYAALLIAAPGPVCIDTERLQIREWRRRDRPAYVQLASDPRIIAHQIHEAPSAARVVHDFHQALTGPLRRPRGDFDLAVALRRPGTADEDRAVGYLHLWLRPEGDELLTGSLGYSLLPAFWGRGLMSEAAAALVAAATGGWGFRRLVAGAFGDNIASRRVLAKCGFRLVAKRPGRYRKGTALKDDCRYRLDVGRGRR